MDDEIKVNKYSIILFIIFAIVLVILFLVATNPPSSKNKSYVGRYTTSIALSEGEKSALISSGIINNINDIKYELILKNDDTFILYVTGTDKVAYTGNYDKSHNKYTLKTYKIYNINKNCYNTKRYVFNFKSDNKLLVTEELNDKKMSFTKIDENIYKYDEELDKIISICGKFVD